MKLSDLPPKVLRDPRFRVQLDARAAAKLDEKPSRPVAQDRYKSQLERDYAARLDLMVRAGEIKSWHYEPLRLRLAQGTYYTPDFLIVLLDGRIEFHETKGFMREAARVRLNVAAENFGFARFYIVRRDGAGWSVANAGLTPPGAPIR